MYLADPFIQSDFAFRLYIFISMCDPWESNPQPFALLTQCSTTEPQGNGLNMGFIASVTWIWINFEMCKESTLGMSWVNTMLIL